ncbi:MAG: P-loop NTPase fold protein, partial [Cyanobacteria bacterium P01_G01_bin.67]
MSQQKDPTISEINKHIEEYLDYYCGLSHAPGFAVLLKGEWGCGKTWFINKYREKLEQKKQKFLYVSLYGITSFAEIENSFFQQLHPVLSSKGMAITGKIFQGFLKASLKIDLNSDGKDDGNVSLQIPKIDLPESFKKADESILIFDDLERCKIDIGNVLGYINYFVEHQGLKVILVANETKLEDNNNYKDIKEKLIGKTFDIGRDLDAALKDFIKEIDNSEIKSVLSKNTKLIEEIYHQAGYQNLRSLKQIILDFERIFQGLSKPAKSKIELLKDILQILIAFSIEIKRGELLPQEICNLLNEYASNSKSDDPNSIRLQKIIDKYKFFPNVAIFDPLPSLLWWKDFFDLGKINEHELEQSILNSKYFADENTPNWMKLWHFLDLSDEDFDILLEKVEHEYAERIFKDIGDIKHVTGIFLHLADNGLYSSKSKKEILDDAKHYIDDLIANNQIDLNPGSDTLPYFIEDMGGYKSLGYQGKELEEFKEFCLYIKIARQSAIEAKLPQLALELLEIMQNDVLEFYRMICLNDTRNAIDDSHQAYYDIPIFKYITADKFLSRFFSIPFESQRYCFYALTKRYDFNDINKKINEELDFLRDIQVGLLEEAKTKKGKPSDYKLNFL